MKFRTQSYFKQIGDTLPKILKTKLKKVNFVEMSVIKNWKEIVGDDIAKNCWPIKIFFSDGNNSNGKIAIKVKRGWSLEIEYKNQEIIEKLNQYFGYKAISKINIIQNFEEYTVESKKNKIEKKITKKKFFKEITNIKQPKLQKALLKLDKTLFKSE
ncbi:MAG: hypothetical protein CFH23_00149 [Alphaproteobacteria bacterium MarineAlpha6_Bin1]|nr:MAG: hypothetical protein CFH23_00149 [Alphaproteobacteria bacterium MarineAlpha6_Bin1]